MTTPYASAELAQIGSEEAWLWQRASPGPRMLLLHGNPGSMLDLEPLFGPLSQLGSVAAYDAPGFGRSVSRTSSPVLLENSAEFALRVMDSLGWDDAILIGHSHGGGVAQRVAAIAPGRVRGLLLLGTLAVPAHLSYRLLPQAGIEEGLAAIAHLIPRMPAALLRPMVRFFMDLTYAPGRASVNAVREQCAALRANPGMLRTMAAVTHGQPCERLREGAQNIRVPTILVHGVDDHIVPIRFARTLHRLLREAGVDVEMRAVPGVGHMLPEHATTQCVEAATVLCRSAGLHPSSGGGGRQ